MSDRSETGDYIHLPTPFPFYLLPPPLPASHLSILLLLLLSSSTSFYSTQAHMYAVSLPLISPLLLKNKILSSFRHLTEGDISQPTDSTEKDAEVAGCAENKAEEAAASRAETAAQESLKKMCEVENTAKDGVETATFAQSSTAGATTEVTSSTVR